MEPLTSEAGYVEETFIRASTQCGEFTELQLSRMANIIRASIIFFFNVNRCR